jgi:hypothetical protein
VLATEETRHRRSSNVGVNAERRSANFGLVTKPIADDGAFNWRFGHFAILQNTPHLFGANSQMANFSFVFNPITAN